MLILSKKRITIMLCMLCLSLYAFSFKIADIGETEETVETVTLPVTNKVIVVDAGHGVPDEGVSLLH